MKMEKKWIASSMTKINEKEEDLFNLAGQWDLDISVRVINPYAYSTGPVEIIIEKHDKKYLPSSNKL